LTQLSREQIQHFIAALIIGLCRGSLSLNYLGISADESGDQAKAESFHRQALDIRQKQAPGNLSVAATIDNLAIIERARGNLGRAEEYHLQSLSVRQRLAPESLDVARSLLNLGNVANDRAI
jgi:tetratricopeptide (TPR) repeat protein